ncbi:uncharacterized protein E0L32_003502 [Thyridium curvatum]|uniref:Uncharacterized protein n=1 Tax=Thyridium curvatum TaxID=1093900 RepID=A0A507BJW1_9PEZI|nr:uncharacterized protein E0L32_003502 [Thyridium curvatum]TPX16940.1 hypothetical protein E0L32_003502 [Thyridium curvatum]
MDQGPESKRPRLSAGSSWSAAPSHHGVSLPNPAAPPTSHHPTPPGQYQPPPHPFSRPSDPHPPPPPLPPAPQHYDGHRHHEPDHFPPIQEHRQPPPSPAHPPYSAYPPRDPMVKRDPAEDTLPQLRRPHSTGNVPEMPGTPHGHLPPQPHTEERRHMSFDAGPAPHPPPPAQMYRQHDPSYPPPTPGPQPQPYDYAMYNGPHDQMYPIQYSTTAKRKTQRASQVAQGQVRRDEALQELQGEEHRVQISRSCAKSTTPPLLTGLYNPLPPSRQDKISSEILEGIERLASAHRDFRGDVDKRLMRLERVLSYLRPGVEFDHELPTEDHFKHIKEPGSPADEKHRDEMYDSPEEVQPAAGSSAPSAGVPLTLDEAHRLLRLANTEDEMEIVPGPPVAPGEPAMPVHHTTLAGLLLTWPPIAKKVGRLLEIEGIKYPGEYPIRQEEQRGLLRVFGRGEGLEKSKVDKDTPADYGQIGASHADISDDMSDISSPSPGDVWGQTGGLSPPNSVDLKGGPLRSNGDLNFDHNEVWKYVKSFEDNIQNMHPLIPPKELQAMTRLFLETIPTSNTKIKTTAPPQARFVPMPDQHVETGNKRKRSPAAGADIPEPINTPQKPGKPFRSMDTALILCVLALGKICLHKHGKLPDVVAESEAPSHQSPVARNGHPASPSQGSPPGYQTHSQSSGLPSPRGDDRTSMSRRPSFQGPPPTPARGSHSMKRNLDVIPGLEYFAVATDIIGNHIGGKTLKHVWVSIFAGLYFGQLGRPLQSLEHIAMAGRTLQSLLRPHLDRFQRLNPTLEKVHSRRDNQLVFAFWSCLQLESDILAELQLPPSGILAYEDKMPYPNNQVAELYGFTPDVLESYSAQLFLRKRLNEIHKAFYDASNPKQDRGPMENNPTFASLQSSLEPPKWVPPHFRFTDDDPPATDILSARLRAKYWGARAILYRPFLRQILLFNHRMSESNGDPSKANNMIETMPGDYRHDVDVPHLRPDAPPSEVISDDMTRCATLAVKALIESTRSFHGLQEKRFIITNVFGTAHAQWGNLLILAAASDDPTVGPHINKAVLKELFARTIEFFELVSHPSSSMTQDMNILKGLERKLLEEWGPEVVAADHRGGGGGATTTGSSSSFSSDRTGGGPLPPPPPPPITPTSYPHQLPPVVADGARAQQHSPVQGQPPPQQFPRHPPPPPQQQHWQQPPPHPHAHGHPHPHLPPPPLPPQHLPPPYGDSRRPPDGR